jgi:hypothetical protein
MTDSIDKITLNISYSDIQFVLQKKLQDILTSEVNEYWIQKNLVQAVLDVLSKDHPVLNMEALVQAVLSDKTLVLEVVREELRASVRNMLKNKKALEKVLSQVSLDPLKLADEKDIT